MFTYLCDRESSPILVQLQYIYIANYSKLLQSLNFLFLEAKPFNVFFIAMQGWVGGREFPQDSFYFLCIFLLGNITIYCMIELLVIMPIYVFYNLDNLCTILFCFVRVCALLRVSAIK